MTDAEGAVRMSTRKMKDSGVAWLEKVPDGWQVYPLKYGFDFSKGLNITKADLTEKGVPVISYGQIHSKRNTGTHLSDELLRYVPCEFVQSDPAAVLQKNDFVFADTSEDLEGLGNCVFIDREDTVMAGYHAIVLRPSIDAEHKYLAYLFKTDCWRRQIRELAYGIKVYSLSQKILRQCSILLPPLPEQRRIAAYLDDRCARIDSVIETTKKTIEDYKALKQSIIFETVTGKNAGGKMKDSGVEWIGKVPAGWSVRRVKHIAVIRNGSDPVTEGDVPVYGSGETSFKTCGEYKEGPTVLLGRKGATLHIPHYIEGRYWNVDTAFDVKMKEGSCLKWFYYLAISFDYEYYISQTTLPGMTQTNYNNMRIPVPPQIEQFQIADDLDKKCATIDSLIAEKLALIADLEAYKKSLVFECVTGKCEVA